MWSATWDSLRPLTTREINSITTELRNTVPGIRQTRTDKDKLYSFHAPEVECVGKGKAHKKYEFGVKVGLVVKARGNRIVGARSFPGYPNDGHTLSASLDQVKRITGREVTEVLVDLGYRGHNAPAAVTVHVGNRAKSQTRWFRKWLGRRSAVEPIISTRSTITAWQEIS